MLECYDKALGTTESAKKPIACAGSPGPLVRSQQSQPPGVLQVGHQLTCSGTRVGSQ